MQIWADHRQVYREDENGEPLLVDIGDDISMAAFRIIKNRRGGGKEQVFAVQTNLDLNRWIYVGELVNECAVKLKWGA